MRRSQRIAISISVTFESKESTTTSHDPELNIVLMPASILSTLTTTAPIGNTGTASNPNIAITGLIPSGNLSGTYDISISGNAATATSAVTAIAANSATTAATATNSSQLGGLVATKFARVDQSNIFTGLNILGNSSAAAGGLVIPPSGTGANQNSFLFNLQSAGALGTNTFGLQVSTTPSLNFMFCNSSPSCTPAFTGLSIANNGILTFAAGQTFPGTGSGTVTNFSSGNLSPLFTTTVVNPASTPALLFTMNTQAAHTMFAGPVSGMGAPTFRGLMAADIPSIMESQVTNLTSDLASKATAAMIAGATNTKITYNNQGIVTGGAQAQFSDLAGTVTPGQLASGTYSISINGNAASATNAVNAGFATTAGIASTANTANTASSATDATNLAGVAAARYARRDQANTFTGGAQMLAPSTAGYASLNVPNSSTAPSTPAVGDMWLSNADGHLQFQDASNATQSLAFASDVSAANNAASTSLNNEISRATAAENTLGSNLNNEISRAQSAETAETSRATSAETVLSGAVSVEASRATTAESLIIANVNAETTRATAAEASKANLAGGNTFTGGAQMLAPSAAGYASLNVPNSSTAPSTPAVGDVWLSNADGHLQFQDASNATQSLAFASDVSAANNAASTGLNNEISRATAAENTLGSNLNNEISRAQGTEGTISSNLNIEISRAQSAETAETSRATSAETVLSGAVSVEASRATTAENLITANVNAETTRATAAEASKANLAGGNTFTGGAQTLAPSAAGYASLNVPNSSTAPSTPAVGDVWLSNADGHLQFQDASNATQSLAFASDVSAANNAASTGLNNEISRATAAENTLGSNLNNEISRAQGTEGTISSNLNIEISRAQSAETAETSRATSAETVLSGAVSVEASRATTAENLITANVNAETTRATAAEASKANLAGGNTFTGGAQMLAPSAAAYASLNVPNSSTAPSTPAVGDVWLSNADGHLQFQDASNATQSLAFASDVSAANNAASTGLNNEISRATAAENTLGSNLNNEISRAQGTEGTISSNLNNEISRAQSAETAETSRATSAETVLSGAVSVEASRATTAENLITANVNAETTRATAAEASKANLAGGNTFTGGAQTLAPSTAGYASLNVPNSSTAPSTPAVGDVWLSNADGHLQFQDASNATQSLAFASDVSAANNAASTGLNNEISRATAAENTLGSNLNNEISRAQVRKALSAAI